MKRITVNTALEKLRKESRIEYNDEKLDVDFTNQNLDTVQHNNLLEIVKKLPVGYRTIFCLYAIDGYSHKEIAEQLNISVGTSKSQLSRARDILKTFILKENIRYE